MLDQEKVNKLRIIVKSDVVETSEAIVASLKGVLEMKRLKWI